MNKDSFRQLFESKVRVLNEIGVDKDQLCSHLRISRPTFDRWMSGDSAPHLLGRQPAIDQLNKLINGV